MKTFIMSDRKGTITCGVIIRNRMVELAVTTSVNEIELLVPHFIDDAGNDWRLVMFDARYCNEDTGLISTIMTYQCDTDKQRFHFNTGGLL